MLGVIAPQYIDMAWGTVAPMLQKAIERSDGDYTMKDIKERIKSGRFQLWAWAENDKIICCGVTGFVYYPQKTICALMMVGGKGLKIWKQEAQDIIADWAKKNGCSDLEGYARKGWLRIIMPQWRPLWTTVRRKL